MDKTVVFAAGKINLSLNILGLSGGMHLLDSVMATVNLADKITIFPRADKKLCIEFCGDGGDLIDKTNNTAVKTVNILSECGAGGIGADIIIEKNLPIAGGMGGSSADCAGVLRALDIRFGLAEKGIDLNKVARLSGSDVPFLLSGGFARVLGGGEIIRPISGKNLPVLTFAAIFPDFGCETGSVYKIFDELNKGNPLVLCDNDLLIKNLTDGNTAQIRLTNALTDAATAIRPQIKDYLSALTKAGAISPTISGSGSTVIGLFADAILAKAAVKKLKSAGLNAKYIFTA